jgi:hypothetical protein
MNELNIIEPSVEVSLILSSNDIYWIAAKSTNKLLLKDLTYSYVFSSIKLVEKCSSKSRNVTNPRLESM